MSENNYYLDDHEVGELIQCGSYTVTREEVITFASKWDPQPWHVDEDVGYIVITYTESDESS